MYHIFFIHSSVDGHLGSFHVLAIVNSAAVNIGVHVSFRIMVFSGYMPGNGIAGSYGSCTFSFLRSLHTEGLIWQNIFSFIFILPGYTCGALLGRLVTVNTLLKSSKKDSSTRFCRTPFQNIKSKMYPKKPLLLSSIFLRVLIHVPIDAAEGDGN